MATRTPSDPRELTLAFKAEENKRALLIAAAVAAYYRTRVDVEDPSSVARWLDLVVPRITNEGEKAAQRAARFASLLRSLEAPAVPKMTFDPAPGSNPEQIRRSLEVVGPFAHTNKMRDIRRLDIKPAEMRNLERAVRTDIASAITASTMRHAQSAARNTIQEVVRQDRVALGYVRVTQAKPCFFCAMLASRGLVFSEDSFDMSDPRFTGPGTAKVHDNCTCHLAPVWRRQGNENLEATEQFTDMWARWGAGGTAGVDGKARAILRFRRGYEHWLRTGEFLSWSEVAR